MKHIFTIAALFLFAIPAFAQQSDPVDIVEVVKKMRSGGASIIHSIPESSDAMPSKGTLELKPTSSSLNSHYQETVESAVMVDGRLEIVKRSISYPSAIPALHCWLSPCDWSRRRVWKEIYGVKDGKLLLLETIEGKIIPVQAEHVEWPKP